MRRALFHGGQIGGGAPAWGGRSIFGRGATDAGGAICAAGVQRVAKRRTPTDFRGRRRGREVGACGKAAAPSGRGGFLVRLFQRGGDPCALCLPPSVAARSPHFPPFGARSSHAGGSGSALPRLETRFSNHITSAASQGFRESDDHLHRDIVLPALDEADIVAVAVDSFGKRFLRISKGFPPCTQGVPKIQAACFFRFRGFHG